MSKRKQLNNQLNGFWGDLILKRKMSQELTAFVWDQTGSPLNGMCFILKQQLLWSIK